MYISKKELLKQTGISYGQLYRWKREGLIPEEWFIKRSSPTGQETFFPQEQILQRVRDILRLKDQYSLDELAKILSPEISNRLFEEENLEVFEEIEIDLIAGFMDAYEKDRFNFLEIVIMATLSEIRRRFAMSETEILELAEGIFPYVKELEHDGYLLHLYQVNDMKFLMIAKNDIKLYVDTHIEELYKVSLMEVSKKMKLKYQEQFHFIVKEEQ